MARARNIKPGFFTNGDLLECQPLARLLFAGLWTEADRRGILEDRPKTIKVKLLPGDDCDVGVLLDELEARGFIRRYELAGIRCIAVSNFDKHQNPHIKEQASTLPAPGSNGVGLVQAPVTPGGGPADSLVLIPDSGLRIPDSAPVEPAVPAVGGGATAPANPTDGDVYALVDAWAAATDRTAAQFQGRPRMDAFRALQPLVLSVTTFDIGGCVRWLKSDSFWTPDKLTIFKLVDVLPQWIAQGRPVRQQARAVAAGRGVRGPIGLSNEELDAFIAAEDGQ